MPIIINYTSCPVCSSVAIQPVLSAADYTVSGEIFPIWECKGCRLRFTQDVPDSTAIASYYKSDNYISHSGTSTGFINKLYHAVRSKTLKQKRKLIENITAVKNGSLLDVGSGIGAFVHEMNKHGWKATGLEPDEGARSVAKNIFKTNLEDISCLFDLTAENYDAITMWHVLEHVHDLHGYIRHLKKLLKENGKLFIAVPNYTSKDAQIYKEHWAAYDVPRHLYHFSPGCIKKLTEIHGLKLLGYKAMWYDSFYISMLSSRYKNGKTNFIAAIINGLRSNLRAWSDVKQCSSVIYIIGK